MDIRQVTISRKQIGILLACIGILCLGLYITVPAVQAGVYSIFDDSDSNYDDSGLYSPENEEYPYNSFVVKTTVENETRITHYNQTHSYSKEPFQNSETYVFPSKDKRVGTVLMKSEPNSPFETIAAKGDSFSGEGENMMYVLGFQESIYFLRDDIRRISSQYSPENSFEYAEAKYEQTGQKTYQNRTVDVYTKTWTSVGLPTVLSDNKIYVDSQTGVILYMDIQTDDAYGEHQLDLVNVEYTLKPIDSNIPTPDWVDTVTLYNINNSTALESQASAKTLDEYDTPVFTTYLSFDPNPIEADSQLTITTQRNGDIVGTDTAPASVLMYGFHITSDGEIISAEKVDESSTDSLELLPYTVNDSVTLTLEMEKTNVSMNFKNTRDASGVGELIVISREQPYFNNSIKTSSEEIKYTIYDSYGSGNTTIQYDNQQKHPTQKLLYQYPKPDNKTLVFNNTGTVTHFALISQIGNNEKNIVLEPVTGEPEPSGTIIFESELQKKIQTTNLTLKTMSGEKIAKMETTEETKSISNVPVGTVQIETDNGTHSETVVVRENTNVYVEYAVKNQEPIGPPDEGQRPAEYEEEPPQFVKPFTAEELNFSDKIIQNTNFTILNQENATEEMIREVGVGSVVEINTTIDQTDGQTHITIHSITNATADERYPNRTGVLEVRYAGELKEVNVTQTAVNKTITFQKTNDSFAEMRFRQNKPDHRWWSPETHIFNVKNPSDERGWIYFRGQADNYTLYNDERVEVTERSEHKYGEHYEQEGPVRMNVPVDTYALTMFHEGTHASYRVFPVTANNQTNLSGWTRVGQLYLNYTEDQTEVNHFPYETSIQIDWETFVVLEDVENGTNGTVHIIYGNQSQNVSLMNKTGNVSVKLDGGFDYVKILYSPESKDGITRFDIHRVHPEADGIDHWYVHQTEDSVRVYDWTTQVIEFNYDVMLETGQRSRYHPYIGVGRMDSQHITGHFDTTVDVQVSNASTKSGNTTKTED